jgi:gluconolactonase
VDPQGRIVYCAHGDRQIVRVEPDGKRTVLASEFEGKRLNSPNDLVYKSDGSLYFSDPPAGLRNGADDPKKELPFTGVYLLKAGKLLLVARDLRPNGLAFTPDEKFIYLVDGTGGKKTIVRYAINPDDTLGAGQLFIDMTSDKAPGGPDGMKVDQKGNLYSTGPGGVWIMAPDGKHLGTILTSELPANLAFGDADYKTLYLTARTGLYRIHLKIPGIPTPGSN